MLSIVTDEVSYDPMTAVSLAYEWGIRHFELRRVFLKRVPYIEEEGHQVLEEIRRIYRDVDFVAISPGLFELDMAHWEFAWHRGAKLDESIRMCERLGAKTLVTFGVKNTGKESFQQIVDLFGDAAARTGKAGLQVAVEPHKGNWIEGAASGKKVFDAVGAKNLGLNWDASNARGCGEEPLEFYTMARPFIKHVHVKGSLASGKVAVVGEDDVGWPELFKRFAADRVDVAFSVETHMKPKVERSRACVENTVKFMKAAGLKLV